MRFDAQATHASMDLLPVIAPPVGTIAHTCRKPAIHG